MKRCISVILLSQLSSSFQLLPMYSGFRTAARALRFLPNQLQQVVGPQTSRVTYVETTHRLVQPVSKRNYHLTYAAEGSSMSKPTVSAQDVFIQDEQWHDRSNRSSALQLTRFDRAGFYTKPSVSTVPVLVSKPSLTELYTGQLHDSFPQASSSRLQEAGLPSLIHSWQKYEPESYEELDKAQKKMIKEDQYAECLAKYRQLQGVDVSKIVYTVDGHEVEGFVLSPKTEPGEKRPLVIYNRGGHRKWGRVDLNTIMNNMMFLAENGYVVVASQYRGTKDDSVTDEFGGVDVADVLKLLDIALQFDNVDKENIFTVGFSRGSIMSHRMLQELKGRISIRAAACIGVVSDLDKLLRENPFAMPLLRDAVKNFDENFTEECKKRSVVHWLDVYDNTPVVFLHNEEDPIVPVSQAYLLKEKFDEQGKPEHKMVIYSDKGHALNRYREEGNREILNWLNKYKKVTY